MKYVWPSFLNRRILVLVGRFCNQIAVLGLRTRDILMAQKYVIFFSDSLQSKPISNTLYAIFVGIRKDVDNFTHM